VADQLFRSQIKVLTVKLEQKLVYRPGQTAAQRSHALIKFGEEFPRRWAPRTDCNPRFINPDCRQYKGPQPPEARI
jgi:hypothetical protein